MSEVAIFSVAMGCLMVVSRFPMMVAPKKTLQWFRRLVFSSNARLRIFSLLMAPIGLGLLFLPFGEGLIPLVLYLLGWVVACGLLVAVFAPGFAQTFVGKILDYAEEGMKESVLRGLAMFAVAFGFGLIYLGIFVL